MNGPMLRFEDVSRSYGARLAVDRLTLSLARGELYALLGHNGAGKTTTIKMLVGLLRPNAGDVWVGDLNVVHHRREAAQLIGYVPDQPFLYDKLSGREFLRFVADMNGLPDKAARAAIERESQRFQLDSFLDQLTESYSHGMRQRTVFAAALIHEPQLLVVDEPMVGLDPHSIRLVKDLLRSYANEGKTVLMSTHTLEIAEQIADRVGVMKNGKIVFDGPMTELRQMLPNAGETLESLYLALMEA
jgi:ABC-2 type transport system ATP-binding protein